jgi:hypothetical protein
MMASWRDKTHAEALECREDWRVTILLLNWLAWPLLRSRCI